MIKKLGITILILATGLFLYSALVIQQAMSYTEEVVLEDYKQGKWRVYEGSESPLTRISSQLDKHRIDWLIQIQDPGFYSHNGLDLSTPGAGLTTITQSIVKKLYFEEFKPGIKKYKQSLIARFVVNSHLEKHQQLEIFLNSAYMGSIDGKEIVGFYYAAKHYYNTDLALLTDDQFLSLIAMLIGPDQFNILQNPMNNQKRVEKIKKVLAGEYIPNGLTDVYYDQA